MNRDQEREAALLLNGAGSNQFHAPAPLHKTLNSNINIRKTYSSVFCEITIATYVE